MFASLSPQCPTLIRIDNFLVNPERIDCIVEKEEITKSGEYEESNTIVEIFVGGSENPLVTELPYEEVLSKLRSNGVNVA